MKSILCEQPGRLLLTEMEEPRPEPGHTILKIRRIGICGTDLHAFEGTQPYFNYPRILGHELSARIESTDAPGFSKGELVTIIPYLNCGTCVACRKGKPNCCVKIQVCGVHTDGGMRERFSVPSYCLVGSQGLSEDQLALIEPLAIGAHGVRRAAVDPSDWVLVVGAGPIGLGTLEFARIAGGKTIIMDTNEQRLDFCRKVLGIEYTINPLAENAQQKLADITNGDMATVVIDATGNLQAINQGFSYMAHGGRYILIGLQKGEIHFSHPEFHKREGTLMSSRNATRHDFEHVVHSIRQGLVDPLKYITHRIPFDTLPEKFPALLNPATGVIKALVEL